MVPQQCSEGVLAPSSIPEHLQHSGYPGTGTTTPVILNPAYRLSDQWPFEVSIKVYYQSSFSSSSLLHPELLYLQKSSNARALWPCELFYIQNSSTSAQLKKTQHVRSPECFPLPFLACVSSAFPLSGYFQAGQSGFQTLPRRAINAHLETISSQSPTPVVSFISLDQVSFFANSFLTPHGTAWLLEVLILVSLHVSWANLIVPFSSHLGHLFLPPSPLLSDCVSSAACTSWFLSWKPS